MRSHALGDASSGTASMRNGRGARGSRARSATHLPGLVVVGWPRSRCRWREVGRRWEACGRRAIRRRVDAIVAVGWVGLSETSRLQPCDAVVADAVARGLDPSRSHPDRLIARAAAQQDALPLVAGAGAARRPRRSRTRCHSWPGRAPRVVRARPPRQLALVAHRGFKRAARNRAHRGRTEDIRCNQPIEGFASRPLFGRMAVDRLLGDAGSAAAHRSARRKMRSAAKPTATR